MGARCCRRKSFVTVAAAIIVSLPLNAAAALPAIVVDHDALLPAMTAEVLCTCWRLVHGLGHVAHLTLCMKRGVGRHV